MKSFCILLIACSAICTNCSGQGIEKDATGADTPVTFVRTAENPIHAIGAVALQSHAPIGIVIGKEHDVLCGTTHGFNFRRVPARETLSSISSLTGYALSENNGVHTFKAPDLEPWQQEILDHRFSRFPGIANKSLAEIGATLTAWIQMDMAKPSTVAASISFSPDSKRYTVEPMHDVTVAEILNRLAVLNKGAMWIMRPIKENPSGPMDVELLLLSYQDDLSSIQSLTCKR